MRILPLALALFVAACSGTAPPGTLGLPSGRSATPAPTASPLTPARSATAIPSGSPSTSASSSPSSSPASSAPATASPGATSPAPSADAAAIAGVSATQMSLTIAFTRPMRSRNGCGTSAAPTGPSGTIDALPAIGSYSSSDRALDETLRSATRATISVDCTSVMFVYGRAAPSGTFTVDLSQVQDQLGRAIDPGRSSVRVVIADEGRPTVVGVEATGGIITVSFSEPMTEIGEGGGAAMAGNYQLDGAAVPATGITCNDAGCRSVRIALRTGSLVVGRSYTLRVANVVDRAGKSISPDPTTVSFTSR